MNSTKIIEIISLIVCFFILVGASYFYYTSHNNFGPTEMITVAFFIAISFVCTIVFPLYIADILGSSTTPTPTSTTPTSTTPTPTTPTPTTPTVTPSK